MILLAATRGRTVRTPTRIASPPGVRCRPAEGARPRCTLSHCQKDTSDRLNRVLTLERYLSPCSCLWRERYAAQVRAGRLHRMA